MAPLRLLPPDLDLLAGRERLEPDLARLELLERLLLFERLLPCERLLVFLAEPRLEEAFLFEPARDEPLPPLLERPLELFLWVLVFV